MREVCEWCGLETGPVSAGPEGGPIVYKICDACLKEEFGTLGTSMCYFLNHLEVPIMVVDDDVNVLFANLAAEELAGRSTAELEGRLGGDVLECAHALEPGGCGRTLHCSGCALRSSVAYTNRTGFPLTRIPASLARATDTDPLEIEMYISTQKAGELVLLRIEKLPVPEGAYPARLV